jgi:hypothetical protein
MCISSALPDLRVAMYRRPALLYAYVVGTLHNSRTIGSVWPIKIMHSHHSVSWNGTIVIKIDDDARPECVPGIWPPGIPPGRIIPPTIRRHIRTVLPVQYILYRSPVINIDVIAVIRVIADSTISIAFEGFHIYLLSVKVFIPYDLKDGFPPVDDFNFDYRHILHIIPIDQRL